MSLSVGAVNSQTGSLGNVCDNILHMSSVKKTKKNLMSSQQLNEHRMASFCHIVLCVHDNLFGSIKESTVIQLHIHLFLEKLYSR